MSHAHTLFCPPFFPPRHLVTSIYSMAHGAVTGTFPVASRYRYIPNTLGRKCLRWPLPFPACVHPFKLPPGLIRNLFRFACFVNSSLRFLIPNLHPICTCSCLFTPLTEGRSPPDLTQAAPSQKKKYRRPAHLGRACFEQGSLPSMLHLLDRLSYMFFFYREAERA